MSARKHTPYDDVNAILTVLHRSGRDILTAQFIGMYLYGSLSSGDFNPESSDIDFIVVTSEILADETISRLEIMHKEIWARGLKWSAKLEGSYIPGDLIRRHDPNGAPCPTINEGKFFVDHLGSDWIIQRHIIRECGVVLEGPDPKTLIDPVSPNEIRQAVQGVLNEWWFPMLSDPHWLAEHGAEYHAFAVLTMCRALYALEQGTIISKPVAARWAQKEFHEREPLIEKALSAQQGKSDGFLDEALNFIGFVKAMMEEAS